MLISTEWCDDNPDREQLAKAINFQPVMFYNKGSNCPDSVEVPFVNSLPSDFIQFNDYDILEIETDLDH